jgi:hypothetical protein
MSNNPALDLQSAIYNALTNHASILAELNGPHVFDDVPQGTTLPYITIGDIETRDWDTQTSTGHEHMVSLHVWSRHRGRKQVQSLIASIDDALDDKALSLQNHGLVNLRVVFWSALRDIDGKGYHGIIRLRAVTEKN